MSQGLMKTVATLLITLLLAFPLMLFSFGFAHQRASDVSWSTSIRVVAAKSAFAAFVVCGAVFFGIKFGDERDESQDK